MIARDLVGIPSPTGSEGAVGEFLADRLGRLGYDVQRQEVTPGRWNVYAIRETPLVVFSTHIDTVPPELPVSEDEVFLYGRGTTDAKGIAAAQIAAAMELAAAGERRVGLLFVVGEEEHSDGAKAAAALEPKGRYIVNGEPTENRLAIAHKGSARIRLTAHGRAAHSAYPEEGDSAIETMLDALERVRGVFLPIDDTLGDTTMNIGVISGGVRANVVPDHCEALLHVRTVRDTGPLLEALRNAAGPSITFELLFDVGPVRMRALPGFPTTVVRFGTDLPYLGPWGERFLLGPGSIRVAHTAEERVAKQDLIDGAALYQRAASLLLAETP